MKTATIKGTKPAWQMPLDEFLETVKNLETPTIITLKADPRSSFTELIFKKRIGNKQRYPMYKALKVDRMGNESTASSSEISETIGKMFYQNETDQIGMKRLVAYLRGYLTYEQAADSMDFYASHYSLVSQAIDEGEQVPEVVLNDYTDLKKRFKEKNMNQEINEVKGGTFENKTEDNPIENITDPRKLRVAEICKKYPKKTVPEEAKPKYFWQEKEMPKNVRENLDMGHKITPEQEAKLNKEYWKTLEDGTLVFFVDGEYIRGKKDEKPISIEFTQGGHGYVYPNFIPYEPAQIWLDDNNKKEAEPILLHELTERNDMRDNGTSYSDAHEKANAKETVARKKDDFSAIPVKDEAEKLDEGGYISPEEEKTINEKYDTQISEKQGLIKSLKVAKSKKENELQNRVGLFGDTKQTGHELFETELCVSNKCLVDALKPYNDRIAKLQSDINLLEKQKRAEIMDAKAQISLALANGGGLTKEESNIKGKYIVILAASPNPDFDRNSHEGSVNIKPREIVVSSLKEARDIAVAFIKDNRLGGGNWTGGDIYKGGKVVAHISYNGRIWEGAKGTWNKDTKEIFDEGGNMVSSFDKDGVRAIIKNEGLLYAIKDYMDEDSISDSEPKLKEYWKAASEQLNAIEEALKQQGYKPAILIRNKKGYAVISIRHKEIPAMELPSETKKDIIKLNTILFNIMNYVGIDVESFGEKFDDGGNTDSGYETWKEELISLIMEQGNLDRDEISLNEEDIKEYYDLKHTPAQVYFEDFQEDAGNFWKIPFGEGGGVDDDKKWKVYPLNETRWQIGYADDKGEMFYTGSFGSKEEAENAADYKNMHLADEFGEGGGVEQSGAKYAVSKSKHTKTGADIYIVKMLDRVDSTTYRAIDNKVKQHGGYWSRYVNGFIFKDEPNTDILDNIFGVMETSIAQNAGVPAQLRGLIVFNEATPHETVNRGLLKREWESGKMLVGRYKKFDGMTDSWDYISEKDIVYIEKGKNEDTDKWLENDFRSSYDHASLDFNSKTISVGNYQLKYKPDVAVTVIKKPTGYFSYNYYVNINKKPKETDEVKRTYDLPSQNKNYDIEKGTRVRTYSYGKPYCGTVIERKINEYTMTSTMLFDGTPSTKRTEKDARYKILLDNGMTVDPFNFEVTEQCNDIEQPLLKHNGKLEYADFVWNDIDRSVHHIQSLKIQLAGRKLEKYRIQDKQGIERGEKELYKEMATFLQWELFAPEFVEGITGETEGEQAERRKLWQEKLNIQPDPSAKYVKEVEKMKAEEHVTSLDKYMVAFNPLISKYNLQTKENTNTIFYMYIDKEQHFTVRLEITEKGIKISFILIRTDKIDEKLFTEIADVERYLDEQKLKYTDFWANKADDLKNKVKLPFLITRGAKMIGLYEVKRKELLYLADIIGKANTKTSIVLILGKNGLNKASYIEIYKSETPYNSWQANDFVRTVKYYDAAGVIIDKTTFSSWTGTWGSGMEDYFWKAGWKFWAEDAEPKEKPQPISKEAQEIIKPELEKMQQFIEETDKKIKGEPEVKGYSEEISYPTQTDQDLLDLAEEYGETAFKNDIPRIPLKCKLFRDFFIENPAFEREMGDAKYYDAWYKGWDKANLSAPVLETTSDIKDELHKANIVSAEKYRENVPIEIARSDEYQYLYNLYEQQQLSKEDFDEKVADLINSDKSKAKPEAWEFTQAEWVNMATDRSGNNNDVVAIAKSAHANHVKNAVKEGKNVPIKVLEHYKLNYWAEKEIARQVGSIKEPEQPEEKTGKLKLSDIPPLVKQIMPVHQQKAIVGSEEHFDILKSIEKKATNLPSSGGMKYDSIVHLHYFYGGSDWFVTEWSKAEKIFYGYAILNGDYQNSEFGSMYVSDMVDDGRVELDFFWREKTVQEALEHVSKEYFGKEIPKPEEEEPKYDRSEFLDELQPLDLWKQFEGDNRWYRKFQFAEKDVNKSRMITDLGVKERMEDMTDGKVDATISVKTEGETESISEIYMQEFPVEGMVLPVPANKEDNEGTFDVPEAEKDKPIVFYEEYKDKYLKSLKYFAPTHFVQRSEESLIKEYYKKYEREWKILNNQRDKLIIENEITKLADALNKETDPEKKAQLWNEGVYDKDDKLIVASRGRGVKGTGKTLWQIALENNPFVQVAYHGTETSISWGGGDLLRAIKKYANDNGFEVVVDEAKPEAVKQVAKEHLDKSDIEKLIKGLEIVYKHKPSEELEKKIRGYKLMLKYKK